MSKTEFATFIAEAPVIEINSNVVFIHHKGGGPCAERTMSIRTLSRFRDRANKALARHSAGDEHIIIDE